MTQGTKGTPGEAAAAEPGKGLPRAMKPHWVIALRLTLHSGTNVSALSYGSAHLVSAAGEEEAPELVQGPLVSSETQRLHVPLTGSASPAAAIAKETD